MKSVYKLIYIGMSVSALWLCGVSAVADSPKMGKLYERVKLVEDSVIEWRRDIHEHPELSNRETRTAALVADHKPGLLWGQAPGNHSPFFYVNEEPLIVGVRILTTLALDYLELNGSGD